MASRARGERALSNVMLEDIPRIQPHELTYEGGEVERGSFGDVRKAKWRGVDVAVKLFLIADKKGGISEEVAVYVRVSARRMVAIALVKPIEYAEISEAYLFYCCSHSPLLPSPSLPPSLSPSPSLPLITDRWVFTGPWPPKHHPFLRSSHDPHQPRG